MNAGTKVSYPGSYSYGEWTSNPTDCGRIADEPQSQHDFYNESFVETMLPLQYPCGDIIWVPVRMLKCV